MTRRATFTQAEPVLRPADLRALVREAVAQGRPVEVCHDGTVRFNMQPAPPVDGFDLVDMSR